MGYCTWAGMNEANQIYHDTELLLCILLYESAGTRRYFDYESVDF